METSGGTRTTAGTSKFTRHLRSVLEAVYRQTQEEREWDETETMDLPRDEDVNNKLVIVDDVVIPEILTD